jgi:hypothetical protein
VSSRITALVALIAASGCVFDLADPLRRPSSDAGIDGPGDDPCGNATVGDADLGARCMIGAPPTINGNADDWAQGQFVSLTHANAAFNGGTGTWTGDPTQDDADCSSRFALGWDKEALYVVVVARDDVRAIHPAETNYYNDDATELFFDGDGDRSGPYALEDRQFIVRADGRAQELHESLPPVAGLPQAVAYKVGAGTGAGFTLEMAVPWGLLGKSAPLPGDRIGFDVYVDDDDSPSVTADRKHYIVWRNNPSGIDGCSEPHCATSAFGLVRLIGR